MVSLKDIQKTTKISYIRPQEITWQIRSEFSVTRNTKHNRKISFKLRIRNWGRITIITIQNLLISQSRGIYILNTIKTKKNIKAIGRIIKKSHSIIDVSTSPQIERIKLLANMPLSIKDSSLHIKKSNLHIKDSNLHIKRSSKNLAGINKKRNQDRESNLTCKRAS